MEVVAGSGSRLLALAGKHHRLLELSVFEGIASERPSGDPDLEVIVKFARSLQASSLKVGGFPPASRCVVDVSKVVEDPVGRPFVMDPRVKFKGSIAVFESSVALAYCPSRGPQRHVGVGDSQQALGICRRVEGADEVRHRLRVLAQSEATAAEV